MNEQIAKLSPLTESSYYVLLTVQRPIHGYGIIKSVEELTNGRIKLAAGTLYGVLQNLEKAKCIELVSSSVTRRKKEYCITNLGKELLQLEVERLRSMIHHSDIWEESK